MFTALTLPTVNIDEHTDTSLGVTLSEIVITDIDNNNIVTINETGDFNYFNIATQNINGVTTNYLLISKNVVLNYEVTPSYEIQLNVRDTIENIQSSI